MDPEFIVLENTKEEMVLIVDMNNNPVSEATRKEMRRLNLPHRWTSILIKNPLTEKYVIQVRSLGKEYCPGFYDLTTGGIIGINEDINEAALRELNEEVGLTISPSDLKFLGNVCHSGTDSCGWSYVYYTEYSKDDFKFNDGEVSGLEFWTKEEILQKIESKEKITPTSINDFLFHDQLLKNKD